MPRRDVPFVPQVELADCAAAALASVLAYHDADVPLRVLRRLTRTGRDGATALDIVSAARALGFTARGVRVLPADLHRLPAGTIVHRSDAHFVVLGRRRRRQSIRVVDPSAGPTSLHPDELARECSGVAVLLEPGPELAKGYERERRWRVARIAMSAIAGHRKALAGLALASLLAQLTLFVTPVTIGLLLARRSVRAPGLLLAAAAVALVLLAGGVLALRGRLLIRLRAALDQRLTAQYVGRLVDLPLEFYQTRSTGHLLAQINGSAALRDAISTVAMSSLLDGVTAAVLVAALTVANPAVALGAVVCLALVGAVAALTARTYRFAITDTYTTRGKTQSDLVSLMFNVEQVKGQSSEGRILESWSRHYDEEIGATTRASSLAQRVAAVSETVRVAGPAAILLLVLALNPLSDPREIVPLIVAVAATMVPAARLADTWLQLVGAKAHMLRVLDVLEQPEDPTRSLPTIDLDGAPSLAAVGVTFSYPGARVPSVRDVSLSIAPGSFVVLVGDSGSGKTTLLKMLIGLLPADGGHILVNGCRLDEHNPYTFRQRVGVVMQNAGLTNGTIKDNILQGRPFDEARMSRALDQAHVTEFLSEMALGLNTLLTDRGASLSGGQRQRIALARAFYGEPTLFLLDEATSQLDPTSERHVLRELKATGATVVLVSHRAMPVSSADAVIHLEAGTIVRSGDHRTLQDDPAYAAYWAGRVAAG